MKGSYLRLSFLFTLSCCFLFSCTSIDLYEKTVAIPGHKWSSSFKPDFTFTIKDTTRPYQLFLVLRHTEKYNFTNIYVNLNVQTPGETQPKKIQLDLALANNNGWLGTGMDDIYEHRISLNDDLVKNDISFRKSGNYSFSIEQIMRENPLEHVLDIGLRIEKK